MDKTTQRTDSDTLDWYCNSIFEALGLSEEPTASVRGNELVAGLHLTLDGVPEDNPASSTIGELRMAVANHATVFMNMSGAVADDNLIVFHMSELFARFDGCQMLTLYSHSPQVTIIQVGVNS